MLRHILLTLPLFAAVSLAEPAASESAAPTEDSYAAEREEWRRSEHNALNAILAFVHNRTSADAAAPRVKALMASPEGKGLKPTGDVALILYFGFQCYGSDALMETLRPLVSGEDKLAFERPERLRRTMTPCMEEMMAQLDGISAKLAQVTDAESEATAIAAAKALPAFIMDMAQRMDTAVEKTQGDTDWTQDDAYIALAVRQLYPQPALDRLLHAYARAPHTPALEEALREAWEPLERLCSADFAPAASAGELAKQEALAAALHEWFDVAATITDKSSADAAADWLTKKNAELGRPLMAISPYYARAQGLCLCLSALGARLEAADSYLSNARPTYFGSEKLQRLMDAAEDEAQMMPVPKVRPLKK